MKLSLFISDSKKFLTDRQKRACCRFLEACNLQVSSQPLLAAGGLSGSLCGLSKKDIANVGLLVSWL